VPSARAAGSPEARFDKFGERKRRRPVERRLFLLASG
jgi:hypothetical protein